MPKTPGKMHMYDMVKRNSFRDRRGEHAYNTCTCIVVGVTMTLFVVRVTMTLFRRRSHGPINSWIEGGGYRRKLVSHTTFNSTSPDVL